MKKTVSFFLALIMLVSCFAFAGSAIFGKEQADKTLRFGEDGKFKIMQIADIQDGFFLKALTEEFITAVLDMEKPDLVVLTGDNIGQGWGITYGAIKMNINNFMSLFQQRDIPVAIVFGNHDDQDNVLGKELQWKIYESYECFVGVADTEEMAGFGTYNIPVYSSADAEKKAFNLWFFDSQTYNHENDLGGYGAVEKDQIEWYIKTEKALTEENGGTPIPSFAFQHIIVPEVYGGSYKMIYRHLSEEELAALDTQRLDESRYRTFEDGKIYEIVGDESIYNDKYDVLWKDDIYVMPPEYIDDETFIGEDGGAPLYSNGQADALVDNGNVLGLAVGHDHVNCFVMPYRGMDIVQTPTGAFGSYGDENRGIRVIELDEKDLSTYETDVIFFRDVFDVSDPLTANRIIASSTSSTFGEQVAAFFAVGYYKLAYALEKFISLIRLPL